MKVRDGRDVVRPMAVAVFVLVAVPSFLWFLKPAAHCFVAMWLSRLALSTGIVVSEHAMVSIASCVATASPRILENVSMQPLSILYSPGCLPPRYEFEYPDHTLIP